LIAPTVDPRAEHEGDALALPLADVVGDALGSDSTVLLAVCFDDWVLGDRDARGLGLNLPSR